MYSPDINFLKDREVRVYDTKAKGRAGGGAAPSDQRPLIYGLLGALVPIGLAGGFWLVSQGQAKQLQVRKATLETELTDIQTQLAAMGGLQGQIDAVKAENSAFAGVFNEIVPWSALLEDLRDRTPARVQITTITQDAGVSAAGASPEAAPPPPEGQAAPPPEPGSVPPKAGGLIIEGVACSFDDINDFVLVLQRSPLLEGKTVSITEAQQQDKLLNPAVDGRCPGTSANAPTALVDYSIRANITSTPAAELIDELERQGAVGLVARLRALRETGVLEQ